MTLFVNERQELPLDPRMGGSHRRGGGTFVPTVVATDSWIWREWFNVEPGGEAVDLGDLAGEFGSGSGKGHVVAGSGAGGGLRVEE
ncbi:MAG: hypothetical protein KAW39_03135 [Thermoplasmata archaeon]|nr:hypothetical protein [Thermoplasmata archaeon]